MVQWWWSLCFRGTKEMMVDYRKSQGRLHALLHTSEAVRQQCQVALCLRSAHHWLYFFCTEPRNARQLLMLYYREHPASCILVHLWIVWQLLYTQQHGSPESSEHSRTLNFRQQATRHIVHLPVIVSEQKHTVQNHLRPQSPSTQFIFFKRHPAKVFRAFTDKLTKVQFLSSYSTWPADSHLHAPVIAKSTIWLLLLVFFIYSTTLTLYCNNIWCIFSYYVVAYIVLCNCIYLSMLSSPAISTSTGMCAKRTKWFDMTNK